MNYALNLGYLFDTKFQTAAFSVGFVSFPFILGFIYKFLIKDDFSSHKQRAYLFVFSLFFSLFLIYSFNIYKHNIPKPYTASVSTFDKKNSLSQDTKLYLFKNPKADNKIISDDELFCSGSVSTVLNSEKVPFFLLKNEDGKKSSITFSGKANYIYFVLMGSDDTGIAEITVNGKKHYIDTFQYISHFNFNRRVHFSKPLIFQVNNSLSSSELINKFLYISIVFFLFFYSSLYLGRILLSKSIILKYNKSDKIKFRHLILYSMPVAVLFIFNLLLFYPGIVPFDSMNQLSQCYTLLFDNHHPVFHSLLLLFLTIFNKGPLPICLFQIGLFSVLLGYFFERLENYGIPSKILFITSLLIALQPFNSIMSVNIMKDFLFSTTVCSLIFCIIMIFIEKKDFFTSKLNVSILLTTLILMSFIRYNGLLICIFCLLMMFLCFKNIGISFFKMLRKFTLFVVSIFLILSLIKTSECGHRINQTLQLSFHQIQTVLQYNGKISSSEQKELNELLSIDRWKNIYTKYLPHTIVFETALNYREINLPKYTKQWCEIFKDNYSLMIKDYIILQSYILKYRHNPEGFNFSQRVFTDIDNDNLLTMQFQLVDFGLQQKSFFPAITQRYKTFIANEKFFDLLYKPTPYFLIFLFFGMIFVLKNRKKSLCVLAPIVLNLFVLTLTLPEMSSRYVLYLFLTYPVWILLSLVKFDKSIYEE